MSTEETAIRTCPLCEAGCGLEITLGPPTERSPSGIGRIRGDRLDVFSHGYICPKGSTLGALHDDPDRIRRPLVRRDGDFVEVGWDEAFAEIERRYTAVVEKHGRAAVAAYVGNPNAHNLAGQLYLRPLLKALGTPQIYSASTVDQRPKEVSAGLMFGGGLTIPVPDIDRTDHLMILGANPYASNGSLATAPDWPGRIEALLARGGRLVVVDPRRSRTAEEASEHVPIRPGTDAFLLAGMLQHLFARGLVETGEAGQWTARLDELAAAVAPFTPDAVAPVTGVPAATVARLAEELAGAPRAAVYGRIGTTTTPLGTVASWLVDALNLCTGNLDRPGGAMFTRPAAGGATTHGKGRFGRGLRIGRHHSRVRGLPETLGELPVATLADEILTDGDGQVRALVCIAGNPVLSTPDSERLDEALAGLELMVAVDIYRNETTRHAHVILPAPSALQKGHYDLALLQLAIRNVANYSPPVLPLGAEELDEWEILARLAGLFSGAGPDADPATVDDLTIGHLVASACGAEHGPLAGRDETEILEALAPRRGPERILDFMLRTGPYGDGFGAVPDGLTLEVLERHPHGIDLGPLTPRLPEVLRTPDGMIDAAPEALVADLEERMTGALGRAQDGMVLVGRRHLRSNNSWMHNVRVLVKGKPRCTLQVHPDDAEAHGLADGDAAVVRSSAGQVVAPVEITEAIMPGVVSLPHGWGHDMEGVDLRVAAEHAGVNSNVLTPNDLLDAVTGTAALNAIPVEIAPAREPAPAPV